jgi:hypothetical protein
MAIVINKSMSRSYRAMKLVGYFDFAFIAQNYPPRQAESKFSPLHLRFGWVTIAFQPALQKHFTTDNEVQTNRIKLISKKGRNIRWVEATFF